MSTYAKRQSSQQPSWPSGFCVTLTSLAISFSWICLSNNVIISSAQTFNNATIEEPPPHVQIGEAVFARNYTRVTPAPPDESSDSGNQSQVNSDGIIEEGGPPKFDDKAVQRGFIVFGGLVAIVMVYLTLKFLWIKRKRRLRAGMCELGSGVYGPLQTSEMNLLQPLEHEDSSDDDETHYQLPTSLSRELDPRPIVR